MRKLIKITLFSILFSCQLTVKDPSYKEKYEPEILSENISGDKIKKPEEECFPKGYNPWNLLISRYNLENSEDYFIYITQNELRLIRNSIYAEKGYRFKSEDLATFFSSQKWYCPKYDNVDSLISPTEHQFINYLLELEKKASKHYDEKEIHNNFLKLFLTKPSFGNNSIPLYFHSKYLHNEGAFRYSACNLINDTDEYLAFIYNAWYGDDSDGLYFLTVLDKDLNQLENHEIGQYEILSKDKIRVHITKRNYDPDGNCYDEEQDKSYFLDTISTKDYLLDRKGELKIVESIK